MLAPLLYAAREGCIECAKNLIAAKADLDLADPDGMTPLNMALFNLHFNFAAVMIKAGADPYRQATWAQSSVVLLATPVVGVVWLLFGRPTLP